MSKKINYHSTDITWCCENLVFSFKRIIYIFFLFTFFSHTSLVHWWTLFYSLRIARTPYPPFPVLFSARNIKYGNPTIQVIFFYIRNQEITYQVYELSRCVFFYIYFILDSGTNTIADNFQFSIVRVSSLDSLAITKCHLWI